MDTFIRHTSKKASRPSPDMLCPQETFFLLIYLFSVEIRHTAAIIIMIPMSAGRLSPSRKSRQPISSATGQHRCPSRGNALEPLNKQAAWDYRACYAHCSKNERITSRCEKHFRQSALQGKRRQYDTACQRRPRCYNHRAILPLNGKFTKDCLRSIEEASKETE